MEKEIQELIEKYEKEALDGGRLYAYTEPYSSTVDILNDLKRLLKSYREKIPCNVAEGKMSKDPEGTINEILSLIDVLRFDLYTAFNRLRELREKFCEET